MQICKPHWSQMRQAIEDRGMTHLVARNAQEAISRMVAVQRGEKADWDPLMAMNHNFWAAALDCGGLQMMMEPPIGEGFTADDGERHYCPLCEAKRNIGGEADQDWIRDCADAMRKHAVEEGLIPGLQ